MEQTKHLNKMASDAMNMGIEMDVNFRETLKKLPPDMQLAAKKIYKDSLKSAKEGNTPSMQNILNAFQNANNTK